MILSVLNNKGIYIWQNYIVEIYQGTYSSAFEDIFSNNLRNGDLSSQIESVFDDAIMSSVSYGISIQCTLDAMYNDFV